MRFIHCSRESLLIDQMALERVEQYLKNIESRAKVRGIFRGRDTKANEHSQLLGIYAFTYRYFTLSNGDRFKVVARLLASKFRGTTPVGTAREWVVSDYCHLRKKGKHWSVVFSFCGSEAQVIDRYQYKSVKVEN